MLAVLTDYIKLESLSTTSGFLKGNKYLYPGSAVCGGDDGCFPVSSCVKTESATICFLEILKIMGILKKLLHAKQQQQKNLLSCLKV